MSPNLETSWYLSIFSWLTEGSIWADGRGGNVLRGLPAILRPE